METDNKTFVCNTDWIASAIYDCDNDAERVDYLKILLEGAQGNYEYKAEFPTNKKVCRQIMSVLKTNAKKRESIIEKRRKGGEATKAKWRNALISENQDVTKHMPTYDHTSTHVQTSAGYSVSVSVSDSVSVSSSKDKDSKREFGFFDFMKMHSSWKDKRDGKSLAWHASDLDAFPLVLSISQEETQDQISNRKQSELQRDTKHMENVATDWQTWCGLWRLADCVEKVGFSEGDVKTVCEVYDTHKDYPNVCEILIKQIEYSSKQDNVVNLKGLLQKPFGNG